MWRTRNTKRGLLGIDVSNSSDPTQVFLYFTESKKADGEDDCRVEQQWQYPGDDP